MDLFINMFERHNHRLATLVSVVIVILLSLSVANTVLFFLENTSGQGASSIGEAKTDARYNKRQQAPAANIDVASLNLFGTAETKATSAALDAPETNLNLELQGVFKSASTRCQY